MNSHPTEPLTESEIHALVDSTLPAAELTVLAGRLAHDPQAQATVAQWRAQRSLLRGLYADMLEEPVPPHLQNAALHTAATQHSARQWWRLGGMAASVVLSFAAGWLVHGIPLGGHMYAPLAQAGHAPEFVRQASFAYSVYTPEVRHPVEVTTADQAHLVQWLSKRLGRPLKVPNLSAQGYELVGGRLLPGDSGARAQFMFQSAAGTRITLYLGAVDATTRDMDTKETAFRFATEGTVPSFYWMDHGFGYALSGQVSRDVLNMLADAVYQQL